MSKQVLTRQRVLELIDQLRVGEAIPSERRLSMTAGSRTIELRETHAGAAVGRALKLSPDDRVVLIRRLRLADGEPMALETLHVPADRVPGLSRELLENASFYELLEREYGVVIASGMQSIEPTVTNEEESELLGVPLHS